VAFLAVAVLVREGDKPELKPEVFVPGNIYSVPIEVLPGSAQNSSILVSRFSHERMLAESSCRFRDMLPLGFFVITIISPKGL